MRGSIERNLLAEAVTIAALCVAAWVMVVQPLVHDLRRLEQARPVVAGALSADLTSWPASENALADLRRRAAEVEAYGELARDTSRLYGIITSLASASNMQIQSLQPLPIPLGRNQTGPQTTRIEIHALGAYQNAANFVDSVMNMPAFVTPRSMHIAPTQDNQGQPLVSIRFSCDLLMFTVPPSLGAAERGAAKSGTDASAKGAAHGPN